MRQRSPHPALYTNRERNNSDGTLDKTKQTPKGQLFPAESNQPSLDKVYKVKEQKKTDKERNYCKSAQNQCLKRSVTHYCGA